MEKRNLFSGKILPGIELTTVYDGEVIEILGYGIDITKMAQCVKENYLTYREKQIAEAKIDTEGVLRCGAVLSDEFVYAMLNDPASVFDVDHKTCRPAILAEMRKFPENVKFFKSQEEFDTIDRHRFSRDYLFNSKSNLYCDQSSLYPNIYKVIDIIHSCGGLAFLAHAFVYSKDFIGKLDDVVSCGLDGVECHYGTFTEEQKKYASAFCEKRGIYKCGGSDFHGLDMRPMNHMGYSGDKRIKFSLIEDWFGKVKESLI